MPLSNTDPNQQPTSQPGSGTVLAPPIGPSPPAPQTPTLNVTPFLPPPTQPQSTPIPFAPPVSTNTGADPNVLPGQQQPAPGSTDKSPAAKNSGNVLNDIFYDMQVSMTGMRDVNKILNVQKSNEGTVNNYTNGSTIIINSDRLILNSKKDYLMLCGTKGVLVSSPKAVHIDCDEDLHLFSSNGEIFVGLPNKGKDYDFENQTPPANKWNPTMNERWEPLPLGLKLANWLQDLTAALVGSAYYGPGGTSLPTPEMRDNIEGLAARLPEILSTIAFIDGVSHANPLPFTPSSEQKPVDNKPADQAGSTTSGTGTATSDGKPTSTNTTTVDGANNPQAGGSTSVSAGSATNASTLENIELNTSTNNTDGVVGSGISSGQDVEGFTPAIDGGSIDVSGVTTKYFYITRQETVDAVTESQVEIMYTNGYSAAGMSERSKTASKEDLLKQAFDNAKQSGITDCNASTTTDAGVWDFGDVYFTIGEETDAPAAEPVELLSTSQLGSINMNVQVSQGFNSFGNFTPANIPTDFKLVVEDNYSKLYPGIINLLKNRTAMSHISKWDGAQRSTTDNQVVGVMRNFDGGTLSVEIDLAIDKLGQVILFHDETLDEDTNASGKIIDWPLQTKIDGVDISASDVNWWQKVKYKNTSDTLNKLSPVFDAMAANREKYKNCFVQLDKCNSQELKAVAKLLTGREWLKPQVIYKGRVPDDMARVTPTNPNNFTFMYKFNRASMAAISTDAEVTKIRDQILDWKKQGHNVPLVELEFTCQDIKILDGTLAKALASIGTGIMIVAVGGATYTQPRDLCIDKTRKIEPPPPQPGPNDPPLRDDQVYVSYDFSGDGEQQWKAMVETGAIMIMTNKPKACQEYLNKQNAALPIPFEITPAAGNGLKITVKNKANAKLRTAPEIDDSFGDNYEVIAVQEGAITLPINFWPSTDTTGAVIGGNLVGAVKAYSNEGGIAGKAVTSGDIMKWVQNRTQYLPTNGIWKDVFLVVGPSSGITVDGVKIKPDSALGIDQHGVGVKLEKKYFISLADLKWDWPQT